VLTVENIQINRGLHRLLSGLSFSLFAGELLLVSGDNGAGKSSLLAVIVGLLSAEKGEVKLTEEAFYLGHKRGLRADLSVLENLQQDIRYVFKESRLEEALSASGLSGLESRRLRELSAGQRQRVGLAKLWFTDSLLWVLDEPLEAIDAKMRSRLELKIQNHLQQGGAVVIATHIPVSNKAMVTRELKLGASCAI
jgi:heme exporter protein A